MIASDDNKALAEVRSQAEREKGPAKRRFYLRLQNQTLSDALRCGGPEWPYAELYTCTEEDLAAMNILGLFPDAQTRLDRMPVTEQSRQRVHLVIFGAGAVAQSLAVHATLVAHYPNYIHDHSLRTRITLVSDKLSDFQTFRERFDGMLNHCRCREIHAAEELPVCQNLPPVYSGFREEFTDIEWEFVEATPLSPVLRYKLDLWAQDTENRQLTLAFCYGDGSRNLDTAVGLADNFPDVPFWVHCNNHPEALAFLRKGRLQNLWPLVAPSRIPDFAIPGMYVHYAYTTLRDQGDYLLPGCEIPSREMLESLWSQLDAAKRWSNIFCAFTLPSKLRSVGIPEEKWGTLYALDAHDVALLAEVEHNRWCMEELILGFRPLTEKERRTLRERPSLRESLKAQRHHPDLAPYSELQRDEQGHSVTRYDIAVTRALPLLVYSCSMLTDKEDPAHA